MANRNIANYNPFRLTARVVPMYFKHRIGEFVLLKMRVWWTDDSFNNDGPDFAPLRCDMLFQGSVYEGLLDDPAAAAVLGRISQKARETAGFQDGIDVLQEIEINAFERVIEVNGYRPLGENQVDILGDPSMRFTDLGNKFELVVQANPEMMQLLYGFGLQMAANQPGEHQPFYQTLLASYTE